MGHLTMKRQQELVKRLDANPVGAPDSKELREILSMLYSEEEASIACQMPYSFSSTRRLSKLTGVEAERLEEILSGMANKGLVLDIRRKGRSSWFLNPLIIGFFEFTMMRVRQDFDQTKLAGLLHDYLLGDPENKMIIEAVAGETQLIRPMVHEGTLDDSVVEVLDYERTTSVINSAKYWAVGLCHCRHVQEHRGNACDTPQEMCLSLGPVAEHLVRQGLGRSITREESLEIVAKAREMGLVQPADNVQKGVVFICNCCSCCCGILEAYRRLKETTPIQTSNFIARVQEDACISCGKCVKACPVEALSIPAKKRPVELEQGWCIGCGVCATTCPTDAITMVDRPQRVHTPENVTERVVRMALERGKLINLILDEPENMTHRVLRGVINALAALPPSKQLLASKQLQSKFLKFMLPKLSHHPSSKVL